MRRVHPEPSAAIFTTPSAPFASQVSLNDSSYPKIVLLDDSKESQVRELGEGIKEIELHGNYFWPILF